MRWAILVELRRSPLRWWLPALLLIDVTMLFGRSTDWLGVWPQASAAAQLPAFFLSLPLAAGAAWAAGRAWRPGWADLLGAAALPAWRRELAQLVAAIGYGLAPLAAGAAIAAVMTLPDGGSGFLWPSYLLLGATVIAMSAAVGHLLGRSVSSRLAAPLFAAVAMFVLIGLQPLPWLQLSVLSGPPQLRVDPFALLARVALAVAVGYVAVCARRRARPSWAGMPVGSAITVSLVGVVVALAATVAAGPLRTERPPPASPLCTHTAPRVCVWPEQRTHLPAMERIAQRLGALADVVTVPDAFFEEGLRGPIGSNADFALVLGQWAAARGMVSSVLNATLGTASCRPSTEEIAERRTTAWIELKEWLVARAFGPKPADIHGGFSYDEAELARVLTRPGVEQADWARTRLRTIHDTNCA